MQGIKKTTKWNVQRSRFSTMAVSTFCYPVPCKMFTSISGLSALDSRSALAVTIKSVHRQCHLSPEGQNHPQIENHAID